MIKDIRWQQRFENFTKAFKNLEHAVVLCGERALNQLEEQGAIQAFEFTFELAWKTLKDYLEYNQIQVKFPREVIKLSFKYELIDDGDLWMDMLEKRNLMAHTYDESKAKTALELITGHYFNQLKLLYETLMGKLNEK